MATGGHKWLGLQHCQLLVSDAKCQVGLRLRRRDLPVCHPRTWARERLEWQKPSTTQMMWQMHMNVGNIHKPHSSSKNMSVCWNTRLGNVEYAYVGRMKTNTCATMYYGVVPCNEHVYVEDNGNNSTCVRAHHCSFMHVRAWECARQCFLCMTVWIIIYLYRQSNLLDGIYTI